ncbi:MAG: cohesin domain-containing protein, partial [Candidatus Hydrogenedentota bacterium]
MFTLQAHIRAAAFGALLAVAASGATLRFGDVTTDAQGYLHVPVTIAAEDYEQVAGLQFDLNFDETNFAFMDVVLGPSAENAGKDAVFTDAFTGTTRVLVVGMNQNTMQDGGVAELVFDPLDASALDSLELTGGLVSDPFGNS